MPVFGDAGVALRHAALDFDCAARGVEHAAELDQEAVAHHFEDAAFMFGDRRIEELAPVQFQGTQRALLIGLHEAAITHHVGGQYRRQPALNVLFAHSRPPSAEDRPYLILGLMGRAIIDGPYVQLGSVPDIAGSRTHVRCCCPRRGTQTWPRPSVWQVPGADIAKLRPRMLKPWRVPQVSSYIDAISRIPSTAFRSEHARQRYRPASDESFP